MGYGDSTADRRRSNQDALGIKMRFVLQQIEIFTIGTNIILPKIEYPKSKIEEDRQAKTSKKRRSKFHSHLDLSGVVLVVCLLRAARKALGRESLTRLPVLSSCAGKQHLSARCVAILAC